MEHFRARRGMAMLMLCATPILARTRKGDRLFAEGRLAEAQRHYDEALDRYEQALSEDPADYGYQLGARRVRFQAGQAHVERGLKHRAAGKTAEALAEFEKAYAIDSSSGIAGQEVRRTRAILEDEKKKGAAIQPENRGLTPAEIAKKASQAKIDRMLPEPELKP